LGDRNAQLFNVQGKRNSYVKQFYKDLNL